MAQSIDSVLDSIISEAIYNQKTMVELPCGTIEYDVRKAMHVFKLRHPEMAGLSIWFRYDAGTSVLYLRYDFCEGRKGLDVSEDLSPDVILIDSDGEGCIDDGFGINADISDDIYFSSCPSPMPKGSASRNIEDYSEIDSYVEPGASSCCPPPPEETIKTAPAKESYRAVVSKPSFFKKIFGKREENVSASAYAPSEIQRHKDFIVRVFLHTPQETAKIDSLVESIDNDAVKKANKSLEVPVKKEDKLTVTLHMSDGVNVDEPIQSFVWQGQYIESDFICKFNAPNEERISGKVIIAKNDVPCGNLKFVIDVVKYAEAGSYCQVDTHKFSKIFISYAHKDFFQVRGIAEGCKINGTDYFFDRHSLNPGDKFKEKILRYIDDADLFVLCWSKNAAKSEWVNIEREHALEVIENGNNKMLTIYALSMPPRAPLPEDMAEKYHFATL